MISLNVPHYNCTSERRSVDGGVTQCDFGLTLFNFLLFQMLTNARLITAGVTIPVITRKAPIIAAVGTATGSLGRRNVQVSAFREA